MNDNIILPFQLETSNIRGRIVRLGSVLDDILQAHDYKDDIRQLTGEVLTLCTILSSMLKYDGIFTLQVKGDGPVTMLVADMTSEGHVRACAAFNDEPFQYKDNPAELLGKGYMAFTVDQGEFADRYQGIVELDNSSLISTVRHYFAQSEQIDTGMVMHVGKVGGKWRASGIMLQEMPPETKLYDNDNTSDTHEDDWRRAMVLMGSVKDEELLSPELSAPDLLIRLFHEEGVRTYEPTILKNVCRCSPERVRNVLASMAQADIDEVAVDGKITMTCEFCSRHYEFDPDEFRKED